MRMCTDRICFMLHESPLFLFGGRCFIISRMKTISFCEKRNAKIHIAAEYALNSRISACKDSDPTRQTIDESTL